jgi:hypothetical protein
MPQLRRRELVAISGMLIVALSAMYGATSLRVMRAKAQTAATSKTQDVKPGQARGRITLYGEDHDSTYFALHEMPKGVDTFHLESETADRLGRLVLAAAKNDWEVRVGYAPNYTEEGKAGPVFDVRVEGFRGR